MPGLLQPSTSQAESELRRDMTTLIYCADGNRKFAEIAIRHGYQYGAQLPNTIYFAPYFTDQNWKKPVRDKYMATLEKYRPALATVLDWEHDEQFNEVMTWAEEAAQYVTDSVIIIPKVIGGVKRIPRMVGGKPVRLGYSATSSFAGTPVSLGEFKGWPIHVLGGGPSVQMDVAHKIGAISADGNYIQKMARKNCQFYSPGLRAKNNKWPMLREFGFGFIGKDSPYVAFELTCLGVPMAWRGVSGQQIYDAQIAHMEALGFKPVAIQSSLFEVAA